MGHFEKGKWIPGPCDGLAAGAEVLAQAFTKFGRAVEALRETEVHGYFRAGAWVSVTFGDLMNYYAKEGRP